MKRLDWFDKMIWLVYGLVVLATVAILLLFRMPELRPGHFGITLAAFLVAETAAFLVTSASKRSREQFARKVPGYLALASVAWFYFIAVAAITLLFSVIGDVTVRSYALIHVIAAALAGIVAALAAVGSRGAQEQEEKIAAQTLLLQDMQRLLLSAEHELAGWSHPERERLLAKVAELKEKIRFSDPVSHPSLEAEESRLLRSLEELAGQVRDCVRNPETESPIASIENGLREIAASLELRNDRLIHLK